MIKRAAPRRHAQQARAVGIEDDGLIRLICRERRDAHMVQQTVEAVRLHQLAREVGIDVLGIVRRLEDQRLAVDVSHAGEAVDRRPLVQLHLLAHLARGRDDGEVHQRRGRHLAQRGNLRRERIAHAAAVGVGVGHEGALAALAHHQPLLLQLADGLTDGIAADVQCAAELRLGGEQVADVQRAGGDAAFDNADQLRIQRNVAVERELVGQDRILFHMLGVPFP